MNKAASGAIEFAAKCLLLPRMISPTNYIGLHFLAEYNHNLCWLIKDVENLQEQAIKYYLTIKPEGSRNISIGKNISKKDIAKATAEIYKVIEIVFGKSNGHIQYLQNINKYIEELNSR